MWGGDEWVSGKQGKRMDPTRLLPTWRRGWLRSVCPPCHLQSWAPVSTPVPPPTHLPLLPGEAISRRAWSPQMDRMYWLLSMPNRPRRCLQGCAGGWVGVLTGSTGTCSLRVEGTQQQTHTPPAPEEDSRAWLQPQPAQEGRARSLT